MTKRFEYFQPNDKDLKDNYSDCVVRSLCKALNKTWVEVFDLLVEKARVEQCMPNSKHAYEKVLTEHGFEYCGVSNRKGSKRPTVKSYTASNENFIAVMVTAHHLVTSVGGKYYDTWDSGDKSLYGYWIKKV